MTIIDMPIELMPEEGPKSPLAVELGVIVKNTFIDVEDGECDPRRCSSSPPSMLRCREECSRGLPQSPLQGPVRAKRWSEAFDEASAVSTTSGSPRASSGSASGSDLSEDTNTLATPSGSSLNPFAPAWSPTWSSGESPCFSPVAGPPDSLAVCSPTGFASSGQTFAAPPMMEPYPLPMGHKLNSNAKAWQPSLLGPSAPPNVPMNMPAMMPPPPPPPGTPPPATGPLPEGCCSPTDALDTLAHNASRNFRQQFETIVEAAKSAVYDSVNCYVAVDITSERQGPQGEVWTFAVWLRPEDARCKDEDARCKDEVLKSAKDALMGAAETSESVYVAGYMNKPFTLTENGFSGTLVGMYDESKACWDAFAKGFCRRGGICRWQHPVCNVAVNVEVKFH